MVWGGSAGASACLCWSGSQWGERGALTDSAPHHNLPAITRATDEIRTNDLRFTKPAPTVSQRSGAFIFERLKSIDSAIETLSQERRALVAQLETFIRGDGEE